MKNLSLLIFISLAVLLFNSCSRTYVPSSANIPLFSKSNETIVHGNLGGNGLDIQAAHSFSDHFAMIGSGSFSLSGAERNLHRYGELGVGYYDNSWGIFRTEFFGGAGYGFSSGNSKWKEEGQKISSRLEGDYQKYFIQGDVGLGSFLIDIGMSTRLAYLHYNFNSISGQEIPSDPNGLVFEPTLFLKAGLGKFKITTQLGFSAPLGNNSFSGQPVIANIGFQYKISGKTKRNK